MIKNETPTYSNWADMILKPFVKNNGYIELTEDFPPEVVQELYFAKTIDNDILIVKDIDRCPFCGEKIYSNGNELFNLNNTIQIYKKVYRCSNNDCSFTTRAYWDKYMDFGANYSKRIKELALGISLICNISFKKISEIIKLINGTEIKRETLYKITDKDIEDFIKENELKIEQEFKNNRIQTSNVLSYDEQFIPLNNRMVYRLSAMDPLTNYSYLDIVIEEDEFTQENIKKILQPIVEENNIKTIVTDGAKMYPPIIKELSCQHKKCNFHKMQNFINKIKNKLNYLKRKIKNNTKKINENNEKIKEINKLRKGKKGRIKKDDKKGQKLMKKLKKIKRSNSRLKIEKRECKAELNVYKKITHDLSLMLKSKSKKTGIKRYQKIIANFKKIPPKIQGFIKNIEKELDKLLLHTTYKNIPTTNNCIELYFKVTLQRVFKKKYKTKRGVKNEIRLKRIRWIKRNVLS